VTTESSPAPEEEPSLPDDVWEQFARDSERAIRASAPKEPSARARMVARRLREQDERNRVEDAKARRRPGRRGAAGQAPPTAWRQGGTDAGERRLRRRNRLRAALGIVVVAVLVLVALSPGRAWSLVTGKGWRHGGSAAHTPSTLAPEAAPPTAPPPTADPDLPTLRRPFAGSPAQSWASGAGAIVPPRAKAYGTSSAAQVAASPWSGRSWSTPTSIPRYGPAAARTPRWPCWIPPTPGAALLATSSRTRPATTRPATSSAGSAPKCGPRATW
jgi:hypothetical protein